MLDDVLKRPDLQVEFGLEPGQMYFINNRWILHNRTAFVDHPELEQRRHLVRLWLQRARLGLWFHVGRSRRFHGRGGT